MSKHRLPLATGVATEPYWSIYSLAYRELSRFATVADSLDMRRACRTLVSALTKSAVVYIDHLHVDAIAAVTPGQTTYSHDWTEVNGLRPPFGNTFLAFGGEITDDCPWAETAVYAALILDKCQHIFDISPTGSQVECIPFYKRGNDLIPIGAAYFGDAVRPTSVLLFPHNDDQREVSNALGSGALRAMRSLLLLECANIDLVDVAPAPPAHRAQGRPGYEIVIRQNPRRYISDNEVTVDWSHRWEVRGHFKHHGPDTPVFRATERRNPSKIIDHPVRGRCVRFWCPPFVKGPENKPLIPKVRRVMA